MLRRVVGQCEEQDTVIPRTLPLMAEFALPRGNSDLGPVVPERVAPSQSGIPDLAGVNG